MSQITRRSFVTTAATGAAVLGAAAASTTARAAEAPATFADTVAWGYEADVVIVGLGGAGAAAAITAAQAGAKTLVVEKAPEGLDGGNTKFCS